MVKPDVITVNPYGIDSPYFRWIIKRDQDKFGKVINGYYNDHRKYNFLEFWKQAMPEAIHVDTGEITDRDWRNQTVNECLKHANGEWILFIEQDFIYDEDFITHVLSKADDYDVIGYGDEGEWSEDIRLHPAFILVRREFVDRTRRDFGAYPELNRDHFAVFTEDLYKLEPRFLDITNLAGWDHLKGTYSNYMLVLDNKEPNYNPDKFRQYVKMAIELDVVQDPRFMEWSKKCIKM